LGAPIVLWQVLEILYHLPAKGIEANVLFMRVEPQQGLPLIGERRHPVGDGLFCSWHGLFGQSANALQRLPFGGFNGAQKVVDHGHTRSISCGSSPERVRETWLL